MKESLSEVEFGKCDNNDKNGCLSLRFAYPSECSVCEVDAYAQFINRGPDVGNLLALAYRISSNECALNGVSVDILGGVNGW